MNVRKVLLASIVSRLLVWFLSIVAVKFVEPYDTSTKISLAQATLSTWDSTVSFYRFKTDPSGSFSPWAL